MAESLTYPSDAFPALPRVTFEAPDDWQAAYGPGVLVGARREAEHGAFATNVVVSATHVTAGATVGDGLAEVRRQAGELGADVSATFDVTLDGRAFTGCDVSWLDPDWGQVVQAHLFAVLPGSGADAPSCLLQVTGTVAGGGVAVDGASNTAPVALESEYAAMQQVMATIRVTPGSGLGEARATGQ